jgi:hypothetical protein
MRIKHHLGRLAGGGLIMAAAALVLGPSAVSFANVNTSNQAGYQVGDNAYRFRFVQGVMTLPLLSQCSNLNYTNSGVQLIGATGQSAAVGVQCSGGHYFAGWLLSYAGNTFPTLAHLTPVAGGDQILVQLYYDQTTNNVNFTAIDQTTGMTLVHAAAFAGSALYKQAVLSADVSNPLASPPPPGTSFILVPFTNSAVTTYGGIHGTGISGPWGVQEEQAVNGAHVIANAPLLYNSGTTFNVRVNG